MYAALHNDALLADETHREPARLISAEREAANFRLWAIASALRCLAVLFAMTTAVALFAAPKIKISTGKVMNPGDILQQAPGALLGDKFYAEVNSASLPKLYDDFREELFEHGIVQSDERYTCKHFAALFAELAQAKYFKESHRTDTKARALAIGSFWYVRDNDGGPHAIVQILTERGRIYFEPQTGKEVKLSEKEEASAYFRFF